MPPKYSINKTSDKVYFNLKIDNIFNNVPLTPGYLDSTDKLGIIRLKTGQILDRQSDYEFSIDFFNVSAITIPIAYVEILEGDNNDPNATQYGFCLRHTASGDDFSTRVIFVPDINPTLLSAGQIPVAPLDNNGLQDFTNTPKYYAVYTLSKFLNLFNTALFTSWTNMVTAHPGNSPPCPPYFVLDEPSGRVVIILHHTYVRSPLAEIYWNNNCEKYIDGLRTIVEPDFITPLGQTNFKQFRLLPGLARPYNPANSAFGFPQPTDILLNPVVGDIPFLPWASLSGATDFYIMMQEYDCLFFWANVKSIVFFSSTISIADEYLPVTNNPNLINSHRVANMTIASPSVVTSVKGHNFSEGQTVFIAFGSYSVNGIPITATTAYRAANVQNNTFDLLLPNGSPANVTAFNPAVTMWVYAKLSSNIGLFNNPARSILSYFDIISERGVDWRSNAFSSPYYRKFHKLTSNSALTDIDIEIFLLLANGSLVPYTLAINDALDIKFVFVKHKD